MTIQLRPIRVSESEAETLRQITGKKDASDAVLHVVERALKRERALETWEPSAALARLIKKEADAIDRRDALEKKTSARGKSTAVKRRRA